MKQNVNTVDVKNDFIFQVLVMYLKTIHTFIRVLDGMITFIGSFCDQQIIKKRLIVFCLFETQHQ